MSGPGRDTGHVTSLEAAAKIREVATGEGAGMAMWTTRGGRLQVAAVVSVVIAVLSIAAFDIPALAQGPDGTSDPLALVLGSFTTDVLALIAAYGAFRRQRWGVILLIVVLSFWAVQAAAELVDGDAVLGVVGLSITVAGLWCCLAPDRPRPVDRRPTPDDHPSNRTG